MKTRKFRTIKGGDVKNKTRKYKTIKRVRASNKTRRYRTIKRGGAPPESLMWVILDRDQFIDPMTLELYLDPVITADGQTYEREPIERWLSGHNTSPATGEVLANKDLIPSYKVKEIVDQYRAAVAEAAEEDEGKGKLFGKDAPTMAEWEMQQARAEAARAAARLEVAEREAEREAEPQVLRRRDGRPIYSRAALAAVRAAARQRAIEREGIDFVEREEREAEEEGVDIEWRD